MLNKAYVIFGGLFCTSCASIGTHTIQIQHPPQLYPGARIDFGIIRYAIDTSYQDSIGKDFFVAYAPLAAVDLPFSVVLDTIFLPIDGTRMILYKQHKPIEKTSRGRQPAGGAYGSPEAGSPTAHP